MKPFLHLGCVVILSAAAVLAQNAGPAGTDEAARKAAIKLFATLTEEQKKLAVLDLADKDRFSEVFPASERKGVPFSKLTADQKSLVQEVVRGMTSEYGTERCLAVAKQTPDNRCYLTYYGEPTADNPFAWRMAMHHLTLLYAEFGTDPTKEFGPVLLGGNPAGKLWEDEEKLLLEIRASLTDDEAKKLAGPGGSGQSVGTKGVKIADLSEKTRGLVRKLLARRLEVFSADRRKVLDTLIEKQGGPEALRFVLNGDASKGHLEGGNYSWKIGDDVVLIDWQTAGKNHLHMTVRARPKG